MWFEEFQDGHHGSHLWYGNRRIVAILNLYNAPIPPIKFPLNLTYGLGGDVVWRISRWPPWQPSWISEQNHFSNSESLCHCDASHQVLVQSDLQFGRRCCLNNFKMVIMAAILDIGTERFYQFWISVSLCHCDVSHQVLARSNLWFWRRCCFKNFKMAAVAVFLDIGTEQIQPFWIFVSLWCLSSSFGSIQLTVWEQMSFEEFQDCHHGGHLCYRNGTILAILNLCVIVMPPIQFWLNLINGLGGDVVWRISRWLPWRPSWIYHHSLTGPVCYNDIPFLKLLL